MALHPDVIKPDRADPNFLLREAAKLGELYEVERQVRLLLSVPGIMQFGGCCIQMLSGQTEPIAISW